MDIIEELQKIYNCNWSTISGYDSYLISDNGLVYSKKSGKLLSTPCNSNGYKCVGLRNSKGRKYFNVHRLVALSFVEKKEGCNIIDHINGKRNDNRACNLRWCTYYDNNNYPLAKKNREGKKDKTTYQYDKDYNLLNVWHSAKEASCNVGASLSKIAACCNKKRNSCKGYIWSYDKIEKKSNIDSCDEIWKPIDGFDEIYHISNYGRVKEVSRIKCNKNNKTIIQEHIITQYVMKNGYRKVHLSIGHEKTKTKIVHRLVAQHFIENKNGFHYIKHIDGNKSNNSCYNLEWTKDNKQTSTSIRNGYHRRSGKDMSNK